jgi:hypothetical protein
MHGELLRRGLSGNLRVQKKEAGGGEKQLNFAQAKTPKRIVAKDSTVGSGTSAADSAGDYWLAPIFRLFVG